MTYPTMPARDARAPTGRFVATLLLLAIVGACQPQPENVIDVVPAPTTSQVGTGSFSIDSETRITLSDPSDGEMRTLGEFAAEFLGTIVAADLQVAAEPASEADGRNTIALILDGAATGGAEGYSIEVTEDSVTIAASATAGLFYGLQTLRQLALPSGDDSSPGTAGRIPVSTISDQPRFVYRGMHLDVGRHLFPVPFIKKYIDLLAAYKMNRFHWHLTEDQGWRIEILRYPRLTEVGAYRSETIVEKNFDPYVGDGIPYGGFYTQDEVREVVEYARQRYITVVPEIEMPGHSVAALAAYPELACTDGPFEVSTFWGVREDIFCPSEATFEFLENVLTEVMELFPGEYIHIGGDEAPKRRWRESALAQQVIRREGLADEHELQSYFIRRIETFLLSHGRRLIGWDEILQGGLAPQATVMSWQGMAGGIEAARQGHDVIMTPGSHVYFDHYQGDRETEPLAIGGYSPLEHVYSFEPVPEELSPEEARHILGAQGNVWTEYMRESDYVEYMVAPRIAALSEVVWSPSAARDWDSFLARLPVQLRLLDQLGINYRVPGVIGLERDGLSLEDTMAVALSSIVPGARIVYTTDSTDPGVDSPTYDGPLAIPVVPSEAVVRARAILANGRMSPISEARFGRTTLRAAVEVDDSTLVPGIGYRYFEAGVNSVKDLGSLQPSRTGTMPTVGLTGEEREERFAYIFEGYLRVGASDVYRFDLTSDDGSRVWIGQQLVVDHDGPHGTTTRSGMIALAAGLHPVKVEFFQGGGAKSLDLAMFRGDVPIALEFLTQ